MIFFKKEPKYKKDGLTWTPEVPAWPRATIFFFSEKNNQGVSEGVL
jgi:hypothetical protein